MLQKQSPRTVCGTVVECWSPRVHGFVICQLIFLMLFQHFLFIQKTARGGHFLCEDFQQPLVDPVRAMSI